MTLSFEDNLNFMPFPASCEELLDGLLSSTDVFDHHELGAIVDSPDLSSIFSGPYNSNSSPSDSFQGKQKNPINYSFYLVTLVGSSFTCI